MEKQYLLTPGPAPIPEEVIKAMAKPIIHHRTPQYMEVTKAVNEALKAVFKTKENVLTFASSGTGAMEASVVNTLSAGDKALVVRGGKFGERFSEICLAYGLKVANIDIEWGTRPEAGLIEKALKDNPGTKAVFTQLCETSTATVYDIKALAAVVGKTDAILAVDVVSGLGADAFEMDAWGVDVAIGGSQKGFMIPPGLSFCAMSKKARALMGKSTLPKFYFDFKKYDKLIEKSDTPWTPAITLMIGLAGALSMINEEGVDSFVARHGSDAGFVRDYVRELGLSVYSKFPSNAVTAAGVPQGVDGSKLISSLKAKGVTFAGGQGELKGKIFRVAHMGAITRSDLEYALEKLKETLVELGAKV